MADRDHCMGVLRERVGKAPFIYTATDYGKGLTDYVRVYVADMGTGEIHDLTWFVSQASGHRMTERGLPFGGGGYSKGLEAFSLTMRTAGREADQSAWREL